MATLTHPAFRTLVSEYGGCDLYFSEMISSEALLGGTPFEYAYRDARPDPDRLVYQLVGRSADAVVEATRRLATEPVYGIDVNMGCSAPHIAKRGAGVTWMQHPDAAARLIERMRAAAPHLQISAKFRLGTGEDPAELITFARALEEAGASALSLHPRFRKQPYSRPSHWRYVRLLREAVTVPVLGSGDITDAASLERRAAESGVKGVMIGRAAAQRPWIFSELAGARSSGPGVHNREIDLAAVADRFHALLEQMLPEEFYLSRARRFYAYFLKNLAFGHRLAAQVQGIESYRGVVEHVRSYFAAHPQHRRVPLRSGLRAAERPTGATGDGTREPAHA
jgi:tRNA-dihydrouridine synthase